MSKAQKFIDENAKKTKGRFVGEAVTYDDIVKHPAVDAIYCPLPTGLRNDWIRKAVAAGKHIYSEKPMGGTVAELKAQFHRYHDQKKRASSPEGRRSTESAQSAGVGTATPVSSAKKSKRAEKAAAALMA